jgi:hypothetical protein
MHDSDLEAAAAREKIARDRELAQFYRGRVETVTTAREKQAWLKLAEMVDHRADKLQEHLASKARMDQIEAQWR